MSAGVLLAAVASLAASVAATAPGPEAPAAAPAARPLSFQARAEKAEVKLGEPFGYAIEIRHRGDESYALPAAPVLAPFRAQDGRCQRAEAKGEVTTTCTLTLALFALGPQDVPELVLPVTTPGGPAVLRVPGPRVTGVGIIDPAAPPGKLELRDIAPPAPLLVRSLALVWWTIGVVAAALAAFFGWRWWRARARGAAEPPVPLPADVRFERRLDALEAERLPARGMGREHVARLSAIVREYLGAITGANALDLTTGELIAVVERSGDPRIAPEALGGFLATADLVKFAKAEPAPEASHAASAFARELLARTRRPPGSEPVGESPAVARDGREAGPGGAGHGTRDAGTGAGTLTGTGTESPSANRNGSSA
ncbi:hypothetical protein [Anaeromyxobacter oryzisoli]|uniref:hypothetical protein n=1 Tax=Anaeromyxobacter oryzisoli TaxID=2925408 RepID=UPI001F579D1A|nr:hypothetical protein [Anaeromyxobacter sp. SG63]